VTPILVLGSWLMTYSSEDIDKKIASIIRKELKSENYDDNCWLKAFSKADGDEQKAKVLYIDLRTNDLKKETEKEKKVEDLKTNSHVQCGRTFCVNKFQILLIPKKSIGIQLCEGCGNTLDQKVNEKSALNQIEERQVNKKLVEPWGAKSSQNNIKIKTSNTMNFSEAISVCFNKYATFEGRADKSEFWYFFLFHLAGSLILSLAPLAIYSIFELATIIPLLAVGCRRLHDINRSGWWQLISITGIGLVLLIVWWTTEGTRKKD